jgi:putative transposase
MDNGPEFTSRALLAWAARSGIELVWIDLGEPIQNARMESLNARLRDECLKQHHFLSLDDARDLIESGRQDYYQHRPHTSLGGETPERFFDLWSEAMASDQSRASQGRLAFTPATQTSPEPTSLVDRLRGEAQPSTAPHGRPHPCP